MNTFLIRDHQTPASADNPAGGVDLSSRRTAGTHAAFALPLLRPGMRLLDAGCGSGSIALGLAERVRPGGVIGVDLNSAPLQEANARAADRRLNAAFIQVNVHELPFGAAEFDGVFCLGLFDQVAHPLSALRELRRVMKPGAFIALRSTDWGGLVLEPANEDVDAAVEISRDLHSLAGDVFAGRKLATKLRAAGFHHVTPSASYEMHASPAAFVETLVQPLLKHGQDSAVACLQRWAASPGALLAQPWFEAVGWKPWT